MSRLRRQRFVYIGPSVSPVGLKQYTIFQTDQMPEGIRKHAEAQPVLRSLYVPTSELAAAAAKLTVPGTAEYLASERMQAIAKTIPR